jgi:hypothetical protein
MRDDLGFEELAPGRYDGTVEKIRFVFKATTKIVITYKLDTPSGVRRLAETILISAPPASASYFHTTQGLGRVEDILRTRGLSLADAQHGGGLRALPGLLEGVAVGVVTKNQRIAGYNTPVVMRIEKP